MSEFVKPERRTVNVREAFGKLLDRDIIKDLHDGEEICSVCNGTGLRVADNPYGLTEDPDKSVMFPYKHQSISFCQNCFNGVVRRCKHCGKIVERMSSTCNCAFYQNKREQEREEKERRDLKAAEKHDSDVLGEQFNMAYSEHYPYNEGYFDDWDSFFDAWFSDHGKDDPRPDYAWGTDELTMSMDASSIVENATEDMYDDAMSDIGDKPVKELQDYLNEWIKKYGVRSYCYTHKHAIKIPWEG